MEDARLKSDDSGEIVNCKSVRLWVCLLVRLSVCLSVRLPAVGDESGASRVNAAACHVPSRRHVTQLTTGWVDLSDGSKHYFVYNVLKHGQCVGVFDSDCLRGVILLKELGLDF